MGGEMEGERGGEVTTWWLQFELALVDTQHRVTCGMDALLHEAVLHVVQQGLIDQPVELLVPDHPCLAQHEVTQLFSVDFRPALSCRNCSVSFSSTS